MRGIKNMMLGIAIMLGAIIVHLYCEEGLITDIIGFAAAVILIFKGYITKGDN